MYFNFLNVEQLARDDRITKRPVGKFLKEGIRLLNEKGTLDVRSGIALLQIVGVGFVMLGLTAERISE
jgi:hypothetical protein